ncbi:MAG: hypothetical protein ABW201_07685 [Candidatus Thiodiazotropha sp.]
MRFGSGGGVATTAGVRFGADHRLSSGNRLPFIIVIHVVPVLVEIVKNI